MTAVMLSRTLAILARMLSLARMEVRKTDRTQKRACVEIARLYPPPMRLLTQAMISAPYQRCRLAGTGVARKGIGGVEPGNVAADPDMKARSNAVRRVKCGNREIDRVGLVIDAHGERSATVCTEPAFSEIR